MNKISYILLCWGFCLNTKAQGEIQISNVTQTNSGEFTGLTAQQYIVTAIDANGCSISTTIIIDAPTPEHCCSAIANALVTTPNLILLTNPLASNLVAQYGTTISNKILYIDGVFTIDEDITFDSCILYFTDMSYVQMQSPYTLDINTSTLQASCGYWYGIVTDSATQKVIMQNNSTLKDAITGMYIANNALVEITDSHFENNESSGIAFANMTAPNYTGFVKRNTFTSNSNMIAPFAKTRRGITVNNVTHLNIGDLADATSGNDFSSVFTGIHVLNSYSTAATPSSHIGIYNNTFNNITNTTLIGAYTEAQKINNCYTSGDGNPFYGAAVFARNSLPSLNDALIEVKNTNSAAATLAIQNCDKAIVTLSTAVNAQNLYIDNCLMGMMNYLTTGKKYEVEDNKIENGFLGMQFIGDNENSYVKNNVINCNLHPLGLTTGSGIGSTHFWPKGIDLKYYNNAITNSYLLENNTITIPSYAGVGITLDNTSANVNVSRNDIDLSYNDSALIVCNGATDLLGISTTNSKGTKLYKNNIYGDADLLPAEREDIAGILVNKSINHELTCNYIENIRFGVMAWNNCNTNYQNTKGNQVHGSVLGWVFRHLVDEGTFGIVGNTTNDNNNKFTGTGYASKVFKFCVNPLFDQIFTDPLKLAITESHSINISTNISDDCPYDVGPNLGTIITYTCPPSIAPNPDEGDIPLDEALAIATDTKEYAEYPVLGHWYDSRRLYEQLIREAIFRNSHPTLLNFYNAMQNEAIAQEYITDNLLRELIESFTSNNPAYIEGQFGDAEQANDDIDGSEIHDENERNINAVYLKVIRYGLDSLSEIDSALIVDLAVQCPYVGGNAVFKARTLHAYYAPGSMFIDMKLCNSVGVYRNGNSTQTQSRFDIENEYLSNAKPLTEKIIYNINDLVVYPNPANDVLNILYNESIDTKLQIINMLGIIVQEIELPKESEKVSSALKKLSSGIYSFRQIGLGSTLKIGKLVINN